MYEDLIDQKIIENAKAALAAVQARRGPAQQREADTLKTLTAADLAHHHRLETGEDASGTADAYNIALRNHNVAKEACVAVERAIVRATQHVTEQTGVAHRPMARAAHVGMHRATIAAAEARAALAKATEDFHANAAVVMHAKANGASFGNDRVDHSSPSLTKPDGNFHVPTPTEFAARVAEPRGGWWRGLAELEG